MALRGSGGVQLFFTARYHQVRRKIPDGTFLNHIGLLAPEVHRPTPAPRVQRKPGIVGISECFLQSLKKNERAEILCIFVYSDSFPKKILELITAMHSCMAKIYSM